MRLAAVFDVLNRERIIAVHNAGYTLDDGFEEVGIVYNAMKSRGVQMQGYCFYHQQDMERAMDNTVQNLLIAFHSLDNNKRKALAVGERIHALLLQQGFRVKWKHDTEDRIAIEPYVWDKVYDGIDYGTARAIAMMSQ